MNHCIINDSAIGGFQKMCNTVLGKKSGVIVAKFSRIESVEMVVGHPIVGGGMMIENDGCLVERSRQHTPFTRDAILCKRVEHDS